MLKIIKHGLAFNSEQIVEIPDVRLNQEEETEQQPEEEQKPVIRPEDTEEYKNIIDKANKHADTIYKNAVNKAEAERQRIIDDANNQVDAIFEKAKQDGFNEGILQKQTEVSNILQELNNVFIDMQNHQASFMQEYSSKLQDFAVDIASQILNYKISTDNDAMIKLIEKAVLSIRNAEWLTVQISEKINGLADKLNQQFAETEKNIEIQAKDLPIDTCIIETPKGQIDASVYTQIENLKKYFQNV